MDAVIFVLDTNVVIPVEPTSADDIEMETQVIADLLSNLTRGGHKYLVHPAIQDDLKRDSENLRREMRTQLVAKYASIDDPPPISAKIIQELGEPAAGSNDEVDFRILAALEADCADYVVTNDIRMRKRAARIGLRERVLSAAEALSVVHALFPTLPIPPPLVRAIYAHGLNEADLIFDSLTRDYSGFRDWLRKCKREHRRAWVIESDNAYAGLCIINQEEKPEYQLTGKVLKICTFKISEFHRGLRYGELLLKTVFEYLTKNAFDAAFVEVFPKQKELCSFLADFGFAHRADTQRGESVMAKAFIPDERTRLLPPLEYHVALGPSSFKIGGAQGYVVPIQPNYHAMLFPEAERQLNLVPPCHAFGNSIRKAYLSHSNLRRLKAGDYLLFYRSHDIKAITVVGVVEDSLVSSNATEIARFVGKRTVYTYDEIVEMCAKPVLAVLFRQARLLDSPLPSELLKRSGVITGPPQSFSSVPQGAEEWLARQLGVSL